MLNQPLKAGNIQVAIIVSHFSNLEERINKWFRDNHEVMVHDFIYEPFDPEAGSAGGASAAILYEES